MRRRDGRRPPLQPLMFGGGQERELRPGTLPVPLVAGLGLAAELAVAEADDARRALPRVPRSRCSRVSRRSTRWSTATRALGPVHRSICRFRASTRKPPSTRGATSSAISNGAACTSQSYTCSHVLSAMRLPAWRKDGAVRFSWCAASPEPDWSALVAAVEPYRSVEQGRGSRERRARRDRLLPPVAVHDAPAGRPPLFAGALLAARGVAGRVARRLHEVRHADARGHRRVRVRRRRRDDDRASATRSARSKG